MTKTFVIGLHAEKYGECTREASHNDEWDRGDSSSSWDFSNFITYTDDVANSYKRLQASLDYKIDFEPKIGETLYAVVAVWSTGDSFGHDDGACAEIFGCYRDLEEANKREDFLNESRDRNKDTIDYTEAGGWLPWHGYFESLDYVKVLPVIVKKKV